MKLSQIKERMAELQALLKTEGQAALMREFKEFFDATPEAKSIQWVQYTPYFNDGDTCTFSVHDLCLRLDLSKVAEDIREYVGKTQSEEDYYSSAHDVLEGLVERPTWRDFPDGLRKELTRNEAQIVENFTKFRKEMQGASDIFELAFGDHVAVKVTRDGADVEEYEHD